MPQVQQSLSLEMINHSRTASNGACSSSTSVGGKECGNFTIGLNSSCPLCLTSANKTNIVDFCGKHGNFTPFATTVASTTTKGRYHDAVQNIRESLENSDSPIEDGEKNGTTTTKKLPQGIKRRRSYRMRTEPVRRPLGCGTQRGDFHLFLY
ncbi:unnamed protein product [Amoebophrya sp. A120]|nr:unnamed protein product [Amoebophrya sp. A120]|eukprot:GSA120T00024254001.1